MDVFSHFIQHFVGLLMIVRHVITYGDVNSGSKMDNVKLIFSSTSKLADSAIDAHTPNSMILDSFLFLSLCLRAVLAELENIFFSPLHG